MSDSNPSFGATSGQPPEEGWVEQPIGEPIAPRKASPSVDDNAAIHVIRSIVCKYPGATVADPKVAQDLVAALLQTHWRDLELDDQIAYDMKQQVAEMLLDDPRASERLVSLWNRVSGENDAS